MFLLRAWASLGLILGSEVWRGGFSFFWGKIWSNIFERASTGMWHPAVRYIGTHVSASYFGGSRFNSRFRSTDRWFFFFWGKIWSNIIERASTGMWHPAVRYIGTHVSASYFGGPRFNSRFRSTERWFFFSGAKFGLISLNGQVRACGILQFGI